MDETNENTVYLALNQSLTSVADAIREKGGTALPLEFPDGFVEAIENISGGGGGNYQAKTGIAPLTSSQTITPDSGYDALSSVQINAMPSGVVTGPIVITSSSATISTGTDTISLDTTMPIGATVLTPGYVDSSSSVGTNCHVTLTADANIRSSSDLAANGATVNAPAGYYPQAATKTVASGSATAPASISGTSATVSTGTNTLTLSKTVSVMPSVTAGYVSSGTATNSSVSLTASVTTQAAQTIHPSTTDQTIAADRYLTGAQTVKAVTMSNLTAANIKKDVVVKIGDSTDDDCVTSITGTYEGGGASNIVTGTFKGTTTGAAMDVDLDYSGNGYPVAFLVYVSGGPRNTTAASGTNAYTWFRLIQRYACGFIVGIKNETNTTPTYESSGTNNNAVVYQWRKNSTSSYDNFTGGISTGGNVYLGTDAISNNTAGIVHFKTSKKMSVFIASNSYGFAANIEYTYYVIYSS